MNSIYAIALIIFIAAMHGSSDLYVDRKIKAEGKRLEQVLQASAEAYAFYDACRPSVGEWVKVECGQGVLRCIRLKINRDRINEREAVVVGSALVFCKPPDSKGD